MIKGLIRRLLGLPKPTGFREIVCADGTVLVGPSPFFNQRLALRAVADDGPSIPLPEPIYLTPDEAREVAAALIGGALEVERDG